MEPIVLNKDLHAIKILDNFESAIWTDRYNAYGDFEIYTRASEEILNVLKPDYYIVNRDSEHVMIVEDCQIKFDNENGDSILFSGRSLESILERRIVWAQTVLDGNLQNGIQQLLNENAISPSIPERVIPNLVFEASDDPVITQLEARMQFTRTNLYESIKKLCDTYNIGFKITLSDDGHFVFKLYSGADRSYDQVINPYVIFSPKFDNILSSRFSTSKRNVKTITVSAGEGEGEDRKTIIVGEGTALDRREMYTDARDLTQTVDGVTIPDEEYYAHLTQRGLDDLSEHKSTESFDGQVDSSIMFKYGKDFYMGDIVQLVGKYGIEGKARVAELINSQSATSNEIYPTFTIIG